MRSHYCSPLVKFTCNSNNNEIHFLGELHSIVAVGQLLLEPLGPDPGHVGGQHDPPLPVNDARADGVHQVEDEDTGAHLRVEMIDCGTHSKTVDPVAVHLLLPGLLYDVECLLRSLQARMVVEQVGNKGKVELLMAIDNILDTDLG